MDDDLEARLRHDPTSDPVHEVGRFRDRVATTAATRGRARPVAFRQPAGVLVAVLVAVVVALALRGAWTGDPAATPATSPPAATPSPLPTPGVDGSVLTGILRGWAAVHGEAPVTAVIIGRRGDVVIAGLGPGATTLDRQPAVRLGDLSGLFVINALVALDECRRGVGFSSCPAPAAVGPIDLDAPIERWLGGVTGAEGITVRQVLAGTSGVAAVGPGVAALRDHLLGDPATAGTPQALVKAALLAPRRFAPGARRDAVDTETLLLELAIGAATDRAPGRWIGQATIDHLTLARTRLHNEAPMGLVAGATTSGQSLPDLEPAVLTALGDSGGMSSASLDLARMAAATWGTAVIHDPAMVDLLADAAGGHRAPLGGAVGVCPCQGDSRSVIVRTGHAVGWSALAAYDLAHSAAIGVVATEDVPEDVLQDLLQRLAAGLG